MEKSCVTDVGDDKGRKERIVMREVRIVAEPFVFVSYLSVECVKELNEHGYIKIRGRIKAENVASYLGYASAETWVKVKLVSDEGLVRNYFTGILTGFYIEKEGEVHILNIEVKTGSFLLGIKRHIRSFQTEGFLYSKMAEICVKDEGAECIMEKPVDIPADGLVLQYQETDWEFLRRIASYAGVPLIATDSMPGKNCCLGYQGNEAIVMEANDFRMEQENEEFLKRRAEGNAAVEDYLYYIVNSREVYDLGVSVIFAGKQWVIGKIVSRLKGQELDHEYWLVSRGRGVLKPIYNHDLTGVSVKAHVTAVEKTVVCVQIEKDENKKECGARWFDYATIYSTPDGTGWYCMPETGDEVRLVVPGYKEAEAYVASSMHLGEAGGRTDPDIKFWKNKQNKEIRFTPDSIVLTNNAGNQVEISDSAGIRIVSDRDITLQAGGDMEIKSHNAAVSIDADSEILLQQKTAVVRVNDEINIAGGKIYMN